MSEIIINRRSEFTNYFRKINIVLDGQPVAALKNGESTKIQVQAGSHKLKATIDWCQSNVVSFEINDGETKIWNLRGSSPFAVFYYITVGSKEYLKLEAEDLGLI